MHTLCVCVCRIDFSFLKNGSEEKWFAETQGEGMRHASINSTLIKRKLKVFRLVCMLNERGKCFNFEMFDLVLAIH